MFHYSGIPGLVHNIREFQRSPSVFRGEATDRPSLPVNAKTYTGEVWVDLFAASGHKISITPIYYPPVRCGATKSRPYEACVDNATLYERRYGIVEEYFLRTMLIGSSKPDSLLIILPSQRYLIPRVSANP